MSDDDLTRIARETTEFSSKRKQLTVLQENLAVSLRELRKGKDFPDA